MENNSNNRIEDIVTETAERIVIDYANFSGREDTNRAAFRAETLKKVRHALQSYATEREAPENVWQREKEDDDLIKETERQTLAKIRQEIESVNCTYRDRSENRDDSYDDAFEDGTEVMQKKILALFQDKPNE